MKDYCAAKNRFGVVLILAFCLCAGYVIAQIAPMTRDFIIMPTPAKKSDGAPTQTNFPHKKHVDQYGATCAHCHPAIADEIASARNTQSSVHDTCRQCHAKNKPGKSFSCARCHEKQ